MAKNFDRIVCFGASSVHGKNDSFNGGFAGRLRAWHEPKSTKNLVYNLGISGETIPVMQRRISEVLRRKPNLIIFYSGYNDIVRRGSEESGCTLSLDKYSLACSELFTEFKAVAELLVILPLPFNENLTRPFANSDWYYIAKDAKEYIIEQEKVCSTLKIEKINLHQDFNIPELTSADGLHPAPQGHEFIFNKIKHWLEN